MQRCGIPTEKENLRMENTQSLATWAQEMAAIAERNTLAQEQQQEASLLDHTQSETVWARGMDHVVHILTTLVQALKRTNRFPDLSVLSYAQSPQGTTTYMRRGTLLSVRGLRGEGPTIELEIDTTPPFRADLLAPTVRVLTSPHPPHAAPLRQTHWNIGISVRGEVVWQRLNPALEISAEDGSEAILKHFLAFCLLAA
jgi:hypothetical protein